MTASVAGDETAIPLQQQGTTSENCTTVTALCYDAMWLGADVLLRSEVVAFFKKK